MIKCSILYKIYFIINKYLKSEISDTVCRSTLFLKKQNKKKSCRNKLGFWDIRFENMICPSTWRKQKLNVWFLEIKQKSIKEMRYEDLWRENWSRVKVHQWRCILMFHPLKAITKWWRNSKLCIKLMNQLSSQCQMETFQRKYKQEFGSKTQTG